MKRFLNNINVKIILVFAALLAPLYILLFVSVGSYLASLQATAVNAADAILELNLNSLYAEIGSDDRFLFNLQESDMDYIRLCSWAGAGEDYLSLYAVNKKLVNQNGMCRYTDVMYVYIEAADLMLVVANSMDGARKRELERQLRESGLQTQNVRWRAVTLGEQEYLVHTQGYYGVYAGALVDMDAFCGQIAGQLGYAHAEVTVDYLSRFPEGDGRVTITRRLDNTNSYLHIVLDKEEILQAMPLIAKRTWQIALISLFLIPILLLAFYGMIVKPLRRIEVGLKRLGEGEQDYRIQDFHGANEFVSLKDSFNAMAGELQALKIESYEKQLEKERMSLQNLILQIRPHFLLNTFNQIFSMAQLKDFEGIQKMSVYLSKYFRYLFRSEWSATLAGEVEVVRNYLEMMERRYLDCFSVEWDLDEGLLGCRIPPLILHNFVENIFKYAVSEGCETLIRISLREEGAGIVLTVSDDGPGIEPEILRKLQNMEPVEKKDGTHIGIWNCAYRLKKLCGGRAQLSVESVLSEGTTVRIVLPKNEDRQRKEKISAERAEHGETKHPDCG